MFVGRVLVIRKISEANETRWKNVFLYVFYFAIIFYILLGCFISKILESNENRKNIFLYAFIPNIWKDRTYSRLY